MRAILTSTAFALAMALTSMPIDRASAQDLELHLDNGRPKIRLRDDCDPSREDCRDRRQGSGDRWAGRRECTPERALDKADRMGVRRARIDHVGRRSIEVRGRSRDGERVSVRFDRTDGRCPTLD
ncbi:hypothetical protein FJW10_24230 [Mesorhizobium sp. B4-1-1]|nr:hypothetical protein FJW10_24230 [Mesorhizobium sp. B4-1-1]